MATKSFSFTQFGLSFLMASTLVSCQSIKTRSQIAQQNKGSQTSGDFPQQSVETPETPAQPAVKVEPKKVAVILGPGGAKALAEVGVLRAFQQRRIPIDKIVGLEWGSLIAGIYASHGQVHDVEWKLYKMQQKSLPIPKGFFAKKLGENSVNIMDDYLTDTFLKETLSEARVPFACPSRTSTTGTVVWQDRGLFKEAVKHCLLFPPIFKAQGTFLAGASQAMDAIDLLHGQGYNVIILVNVLPSGPPLGQESLADNMNYAILWQEVTRSLAQAEKSGVDVVRVDTGATPITQFESVKELGALGEAAGLKAADGLISKYGF